MFEWLDEEIGRIKTRRFHRVDGPPSSDLRQAIETGDFSVPPSYIAFILKYGGADLYRTGSSYYVSIFESPNEAETSDGETFLHIGRTWTSNVFFKENMLMAGSESPVFESDRKSFRKTADGFEEWIVERCKAARKRYKKKEWEEIEKGPAPFTPHDLSILEARNHFKWRVIGIAPNQDIRFEVTNGSNLVIPFLSLATRGPLRESKNEPLEGGVFLPVGSIRPGETRVIEFDCYKQWVAPEDLEIFDLPTPWPEDRDQYWEFKSVN